MTLLNMSFYGAVIISAILIIRAFTLHKLPKKTFLVLWAVALVRLLVPFEISSGLSLYSLLPEDFRLAEENTYAPNPKNPYAPFDNYADYLENERQNTVSVETDDSTGAVYLPVENPEGGVVSLPNTEPDTQTTGTGNHMPDAGFTWSDFMALLPTIWGIGALLCAVFFLASYLRCHREFSTSLPVTEDYATEWLKKHPLKRTISIRQSDIISAPLTYGIFRPVILMPKKTDWSNKEQLDYILYHEFTHIRRFDLLAKLVMIAALCLHWFNPFVWAMYVFFNRDLELSCDDCVVKHFGETKAEYAGTLIGMEEKKNYGTPMCNHFSKNAIEERITAIMKSKKTTVGMIIAAVVIVIIVVVTLTTGRKDEDTATDITPTPAESITPAPTGAEGTPVPTGAEIAQPTPAPGDDTYFPERDYTYSGNNPGLFEYDNKAVSQKNGYDFEISSFVSAGGKNVLSNLTINLEEYAGNTAWWCLAAFYDETTNNVYLEFVPAPEAEAASSGILHVTIPVSDPASYTVHPAGNFEDQKAAAFWFSEICKIQNKIYFNHSNCYGSLWVYDISTGEMTDLSYVNQKMQALANELCAGFGWETEPVIWFYVGWHSKEGITTYEAHVCKEADTGAFFNMRVFYQDDLYLDYSYIYTGPQDETPTRETLTSQLQEQFYRYQKLQEEFFTTNLKVAPSISSDDWVTINGTGGYTRVTDERFPNLQSVIDYMETICTPQFAMNLRIQHWRVTSGEPTVIEHNGILYTRCYDSVKLAESYAFSPVDFIDTDRCSLSYEAYIGIPSNKTESGTVYFEYTDGSWHVSNHTYTYYHNYVDSLDIQIMTELFSKYRTMWIELFNSNLECGYYSHLPLDEIIINGREYYKVLDERFPTMQSLIAYMETIYTPDFAAELRNKYNLSADSDYPLLAEQDGVLYTQAYHSSTNGFFEEFQFTDLQQNGSDTVIVSYQSDSTPFAEPNMVEAGIITFKFTEGGWHIASLDWEYKQTHGNN